jgi:phospholipid/cholesterol/gamma-HCH transport system substrate-binding protein
MTHGISLTGEKQIVLSGGRFDEPDVQEGGYVPAEKTAFDAIANKATDIISHVDSLMTNLNSIFSEENSQSISNSLKNFENATQNLNRLTQNLNAPINNISNAANSMKNVLSEIEEAKIAAKAGENMDVLKEKLEAIDTKAMNENLTQAMESIKQLTQRLDQVVYKNQDQVGDAVVELNAVLENLEEFTQKIKNNPSVLIHAENKSRRK